MFRGKVTHMTEVNMNVLLTKVDHKWRQNTGGGTCAARSKRCQRGAGVYDQPFCSDKAVSLFLNSSI